MNKFIILISIFALFLVQCTNDKETSKNSDSMKVSGELIIFHAGSLSIPFKDMRTAFNKVYPDVKVILEAAGSVKCARKITDLELDCDIMASADYKVIDKFLIPEYTGWNIKFAVNEMAIAYNEQSRRANEINVTNWHEILLKDNVAYGRADPNSDPCGYRSVLVSKLAEKHYNLEGFSKTILEKDTKHIRPKETDLLALLEVNSIDYLFIYKSVAEQHNLKFIVLPDEINLKKSELKELYATVSVDIAGKKPGEKVTMIGDPMVYGITGIKNSPNEKAKITFLDFVLSAKGQEIMHKNGQSTKAPYVNEHFDKIPAELQKYAKK